jgi:hypothetical protein
VAACCAVRAFARRYAPGARSVIALSSDLGERAVFGLESAA